MSGQSRAARRRSSRRRLAQHFLGSADLAAALVERAEISGDDRVVEIGAGEGVLTEALARHAGLVLAIELDTALILRLESRFASTGNVVVLHADALEQPLPANPFRVVANPPFHRTAALLHRLLDDPSDSLVRADLIVQWQVARARATTDLGPPTDLLGATWGPWWRFGRGMRLPARCFRPPPSVDAAVLVVTRRDPALLAARDRSRYAAFVRRGFERSTFARDLSVEQWAHRFALDRGRRARSQRRRRRST